VKGSFDPQKIQYVTGPKKTLAPGESGSAMAVCPSGTTAISGGFFTAVALVGFSTTFGSTFHSILAYNDTPTYVDIHATVVCAAP
jgi:hypothetical protein